MSFPTEIKYLCRRTRDRRKKGGRRGERRGGEAEEWEVKGKE